MAFSVRISPLSRKLFTAGRTVLPESKVIFSSSSFFIPLERLSLPGINFQLSFAINAMPIFSSAFKSKNGPLKEISPYSFKKRKN